MTPPATDPFQPLLDLQPGWNDEGDAPVPTPEAVATARAFYEAGQKAGLPEPEIDADVLGGVGLLYRHTETKHRVWVASMNTGRASVLFTSELGSIGRPLKGLNVDAIWSWMRGKSDQMPPNPELERDPHEGCLCPHCYHDQTVRARIGDVEPDYSDVARMVWRRPPSGVRGQMVSARDEGAWLCPFCGLSASAQIIGALLDAVLGPGEPPDVYHGEARLGFYGGSP